MHTNVVMVNWIPNGNTDIHERIKAFSITITVVSSEGAGKYYGEIFSLEMLL
jgi:hypothetical protein